jgi:hypothetical protein
VLPNNFSERQVDRPVEFLHALTDPGSIDLRSDQDVVRGVAGGLPLDD